ncbi:DNA-binding response regulator [Edaphobacter acidisoli]|uniref:DNA-binding response regulator n=1 Tax=Edaphobacter acidisoli TaxID=2040573 RepID=A0A916RYW7_9BACT|nr:response regulator transcription factor [Edaphobacter acidisoli]GGA73582.1 DNA-binding response regulator [Edaphobacter acidisoli]
MPEIRILLVDDHSLFRESLTRLLETSAVFQLVAHCATVSDALARLSTNEIDVILLDYDLGEDSGLHLLAELKQCSSRARVLMVTAGLSDEATLQVIEAGAAGIFLKQGNPEQLIAAIKLVASGGTWLDAAAVQSIISGQGAHSKQLNRTHSLTSRQSEVLRGILDGLANKEIAWKLNTSESSVKAVIQELFHKAGVRTRSQLVRIAIEKHSSDWLHPR